MVSDSFRSTARDRAGPRASPWGAAYDGLIRRRAYGLRLAAAPFAFPLLQALVRGAAGDVVALVGAGALLLWAGRAVDRGLLAGEGKPEPVRIAGLAVPPRLAGALATGLAALLISVGAAHDRHLMALVFGALGFAGCALAYGLEPMQDRGRLVEAARRATSRPEPAPRAASTVDPILAEARRKIADIEAAAASLHSRELTSRLAQIVARARRVLDLVERKPGDLSRARRFLATYLDGTRDVVAVRRPAARSRRHAAGRELPPRADHGRGGVRRAGGGAPAATRSSTWRSRSRCSRRRCAARASTDGGRDGGCWARAWPCRRGAARGATSRPGPRRP